MLQAQITSFGGLDLETKYPKNSYQAAARRDHLPIAPNKAHPDNRKLLRLDNSSGPLRKKSYVKTRDMHSIRLACLRPYYRRGPEVYLSDSSYQTLVAYIQYSEPQDEPTFYASVHVREYDLERAISAQRTGHDRPRSWTQTASITAASRADMQPLLPPPEIYRPQRYGTYTTLPTTHPIQSGYGDGSSRSSDSEKFWKCVKIIFWTLVVLSVLSYGVYRGGCWTIAACRRAVARMSEGLGSIGKKASGVWSSTLQAVGFGKAGVVSGTADWIWELVAADM